MKKLTRMPERKGIWLSDYKDVKYKTGFQWFAEFVIAALALLVGFGFGYQVWQDTSNSGSARVLGLFWPAALVSYGFVKLPGSIIYLVRRRRGEPIDVWDCETPDDPAVQERRHPHH